MPERCPSEEMIAAYVNHNATAEERQQVEAHLTKCEECSDLIAFLVRLPEPQKVSSKVPES